MIPVEIRMALWDLMDAIEKEKGLEGEARFLVQALYIACQNVAAYIDHQERKEN